MAPCAEPPPGQRIVWRGKEGYPAQLAVLTDAPPRLYVVGDPDLLAGPAVAVVGSRQATGLGLAMSEKLGGGLAASGVVVVSGCAIGIDAAAHRGALAVGGPTVGVLGGGLDVAAPPSNRDLAARIGREGCLISEHAAGTPAMAYHFPRRNRIIAGLVRIVVVVEATARSGALITARLALAAGREVMAVPGHPLVPTTAGANALLADGARPALCVEDVLEELAALPPLPGLPEDSVGLLRVVRAPISRPGGAGSGLSQAAGMPRRLLAALSDTPEPAEALALSVGAPLADVLAAITELEILGLARVHPGSRFTRSVVG